MPKQAPSSVEKAKAWLRSYAISLFDRKDGHAADWGVIAQVLFAAAFSVVDEAEGDARARQVLRWVEGGVYGRLACNHDGLLPALAMGLAAATPDPLRPGPL